MQNLAMKYLTTPQKCATTTQIDLKFRAQHKRDGGHGALEKLIFFQCYTSDKWMNGRITGHTDQC